MDTVAVDVGTATVNLIKWDGRTLQVEKLPTGDPVVGLPLWLDLLSPRPGFEFRYSSTRHDASQPDIRNQVIAIAVNHGASSPSDSNTEDTFGPGHYALSWLAARHRLSDYIGLDIGATAHRARWLQPRKTGFRFGVGRRVKNKPGHATRGVDVASIMEGMQRLSPDVSAPPLICSGGDGPLVAAELAMQFGLRQVIVPDYAGCFEALGLFCMPKVFHVEQPMHDQSFSIGPLRDAFLKLMEEVSRRISMVGLDFDDVTCSQGVTLSRLDELAVQLDIGVRALNEQEIIHSFAQYSQSDEVAPRDIIMRRAYASAQTDTSALELLPPPLATARHTAALSDAEVRTRFSCGAIVERHTLGHGETINGPVAIREPWHMTIVPDGWVAEIALAGGIVLTNRDGY